MKRLSDLGQAIIACAVFWMLVFLFILLCCRSEGAPVTLTWDTPPPAEQIRAWKVFRGIEVFPETLTNSITIDIPTDQVSTIEVRAENIIGQHTTPAVIVIVPFTPKHSTDLKAWTLVTSKVIFLEATPKRFMSYDYPKP